VEEQGKIATDGFTEWDERTATTTDAALLWPVSLYTIAPPPRKVSSGRQNTGRGKEISGERSYSGETFL